MKKETIETLPKPPYAKPVAAILNGPAAGRGVCAPGSGDMDFCSAGSSASGDGCLPGSGAGNCNNGAGAV